MSIDVTSTNAAKRPILAAIMVSIGLVAIDITILSTTVSVIAADFEDGATFPWLFTGYLLGTTVTMPLYSKLGDIVGRKKVLLFGLGVFLLASVYCSLSTSMLHLII